jgi:hypothetical protein
MNELLVNEPSVYISRGQGSPFTSGGWSCREPTIYACYSLENRGEILSDFGFGTYDALEAALTYSVFVIVRNARGIATLLRGGFEVALLAPGDDIEGAISTIRNALPQKLQSGTPLAPTVTPEYAIGAVYDAGTGARGDDLLRLATVDAMDRLVAAQDFERLIRG